MVTLESSENIFFSLEVFEKGDNPLEEISTENIIESFQDLIRKLARPRNPLQEKLRPLGLAFLLQFLHRDNLERALRLNLRSSAAFEEGLLDGSNRMIARPLGTIGHWLAGNVPLLSILSLVQAMLCKNRSLVKLSSKQEDHLSPILELLEECQPAGPALKKSVLVLPISSSDKEANQKMASLCDLRIAWGGEEAVAAVAQLPTSRPEQETLCFGPKFSLGIVRDRLLSEEATGLARDLALFNQEACSSPHALLVMGDLENCAESIGKALNQLSSQSIYPKSPPYEASKILNYRTEQAMLGERLHCSKGTQWTLHLHKGLRPLTGLGSRILHLFHIEDFKAALPFLPSNLQTVGHNLSDSELLELSRLFSPYGVSRLVPFGQAHQFSFPWDSYFPMERMVRWLLLSPT